MKNQFVEYTSIGTGAFVDSTAKIYAKKLALGKHSHIGPGVIIDCDTFVLGEYSRIYDRTLIRGRKGHGTVSIGHNAWIASDVIMDTEGGLTIENNVTIGAKAAIWTHAQPGCCILGAEPVRSYPLRIGMDAWIGCHCVVAVNIPYQALLIAGSIATREKDVIPNHYHAGNPAQAIPEVHFKEIAEDVKLDRMKKLVWEFEREYPAYKGLIRPVRHAVEGGGLWFDVNLRLYANTGHPAEVAFLKMMTPRCRFLPVGQP